MSLKIGEVSKLLGISVESIRFYERQDIINPSRKELSKYREYEAWDIFYLIGCIRYRNIGFSVKEISRMLHTESLDYLNEKIGDKIEDVAHQINYNMLLREYLENYKRKLETVSYNVGNFWFSKQPEKRYMPTIERHGETYTDFDPENLLFAEWVRKMPFVGSAQHIAAEDLFNHKSINRDTWSLMVDSRYIPIIGLPINDTIKTLPARLCLCTIIDGGSRGSLSLSLLEPALAYIDKTGYRICGDIIGDLLSRIHKDGEYYRYIEIMIPVEKS